MTTREQSTRLEIGTILPIPIDQRHGRAHGLFTVRFGAYLMLLTVVTGGLAVTVVCYVMGIAVQLPFVASQLYTGPVARNGRRQPLVDRRAHRHVAGLLLVGEAVAARGCCAIEIA